MMMNEINDDSSPLAQEVRGLLQRIWPELPMVAADACCRTVQRIDAGDVCILCQPEEVAALKAVAAEHCSIVSESIGDNSLFILAGRRLYTRRNFCYEQSMVSCLDRMLCNQLPPIPGLEQGSLSDRQFQALQLMSVNQFTLLSGGPGTGKTYTIARAVQGALTENPQLKIRLCAPTAKASRRLMESMGEEFCAEHGITATTIHSLLEPRPDLVTFWRNRENPLVAGWVIVDEVSMLGLPLLAKLLDALPDGCRLTLAGDKDQLASVERGCVFGDLCRKYTDNLAVLTESRRFPPEGDIAQLAQAVNSGNWDATRCRLGAGTDVVYHPVTEAMAFNYSHWPYFNALVTERLKAFAEATTPQEAAEHLGDFKILCALRKGAFGVECINEYLRSIMPRSAPIPWMITQNDRETAVVNGSMAIEMPGEADYLYMADGTGNTMRKLHKHLVPNRELAYAITVHKSQGSEYEEVCLVLPAEGKSPILTREILYTAITRTRAKVSVYGSDDALRTCVCHRVQRVSGMFE